MKKKIINIVENILLARRNGNIKREQHYYNLFMEFCEKHNINQENAFEGAKNHLKTRIAPIMNGLV